MVRKKFVNFLSTCQFISIGGDESDSFSGSAPLASSLQACNPLFEWFNGFSGQRDVAADKTGAGIHRVLKAIIDSLCPDIWPKIMWLCTDGASAMRSTPAYMGLDSNPAGTSLHACMKRSVNKQLPAFHCMCHMLNLAFKDAFFKCLWAEHWLYHVKSLFNWFSNSPGKKSALRRLHQTMVAIRQTVTWRLVYPRYYCPTRWLGLHQALLSILNSWDLLVIYAGTLQDDGFRPDRRPYAAEPEEEELQGEDLADARVDDLDDVVLVHQTTFHQWDDKAWDLKVGSIEDDEDFLPNSDLIDLDHGNSSVWRGLDDGVRGKRSKLLSEDKGLTNLNLGLDSMMADVLFPYVKLVKRLQTASTPIAHQV